MSFLIVDPYLEGYIVQKVSQNCLVCYSKVHSKQKEQVKQSFMPSVNQS